MKSTLGREDFKIEPRLLLRGLVDNGWIELPINTVGVDALPPLHKDPFDRLLLAQALSEGITLLTSDANLARYGGPGKKGVNECQASSDQSTRTGIVRAQQTMLSS